MCGAYVYVCRDTRKKKGNRAAIVSTRINKQTNKRIRMNEPASKCTNANQLKLIKTLKMMMTMADENNNENRNVKDLSIAELEACMQCEANIHNKKCENKRSKETRNENEKAKKEQSIRFNNLCGPK